MNIHWHSKDKILEVVKENLTPAHIALDIGCGIRPQNYIAPLVHICCDPFKQYVDHLQKKVETEIEGTILTIKASWKDIAEKLPLHSVDTIFLLDVIEHLEKEEGMHLLKLTERIAKRQIIIFTPIGFLPQEHENNKDAWGLNGVEYQEHRSGWIPDEDFDNSWDIYACNDYHVVNNLGEPFEKPHGAFWAIKNLSSHDYQKGNSILVDVNKIMRALEVDPLDSEEFLSTVLVRAASAVRKIQTAEEVKRRCMEESEQLMQDYNKLLFSDTYKLGQRIAKFPWIFKPLVLLGSFLEKLKKQLKTNKELSP